MSKLIVSTLYKNIPVTFIEESVDYYNKTGDKKGFQERFTKELFNKTYEYDQSFCSLPILIPLLTPSDNYRIGRQYECFVDVFNVYDSIMNDYGLIELFNLNNEN